MNLKTVSRYVGYALLVSALFMLLSLGVSLLNGRDSGYVPLLVSFLITFIFGVFPFIFVRRTNAITLKEGYLIITLSWLLSFVFGMLPYALWGGPFTVSNAWFESVSGFTTTGATILDDVEALPLSLIFWRSSTHFIGGLGVVVFLLLIIPNTSPVKLRLTNMELSNLSKGSYSVRTNRTVYIFAYVYLGLMVLALVCYLLAGMSLFDATCHAFSICAAGGFSSRNLSIASFNSPVIEVMTTVLMLLSSIHFELLFLAVVNRSLKPMNNPVLKAYLLWLLVCMVSLTLILKLDGAVNSWLLAFHYASFQTISTASTTGFSVVDYSGWPVFANTIILSLALVCACAGSPSGGIKADRILIALKSIGRQTNRILHPSSVNEVKLGDRYFRDSEVYPHLIYIMLYGLLLMISVVLSVVCGVNAHSSIAASISSLGNVGPAVQELGGFGSFNPLPASAKFLYSFDMFLGRIEIYPVLAVFTMLADRRHRGA
ncbi:MAG: TrkH family potassium uptake protein [Bacteroidales bacterium]|nr:TrkH family potassium uptake protein [Bacteroidales bacterium]